MYGRHDFECLAQNSSGNIKMFLLRDVWFCGKEFGKRIDSIRRKCNRVS